MPDQGTSEACVGHGIMLRSRTFHAPKHPLASLDPTFSETQFKQVVSIQFDAA